MNRRGFLGSILAFGAAPAIVRADSLMKVIPRDLAVYSYTTTELARDVDEFFLDSPACGNRLLTIDQITREAMKILHDKIERSSLEIVTRKPFIAKSDQVRWL